MAEEGEEYGRERDKLFKWTRVRGQVRDSGWTQQEEGILDTIGSTVLHL